MNTSYRPDIDGLRAIAVISVVIYHAELFVFGYRLVPAGFLGVDIFFVISGYLITNILLTEVRENRFSIARFYERRARRILPVLFLVILCTMPFAWWLMLPTAMEDFAGSVITSVLYTSNFWFWSSDSYWGQASALKPLLHTWSLSVEEQFYLIVPWLILLLAKRTILMFLAFVILALASLVVAQAWSHSLAESAFYLLPARAWELLFGSLVAVLVLKPKKIVTRTVLRECLTGLGLVMIIGSILFFDSSLRHPSFWTLIPVIGTSLAIANGANTNVTALITSKPILWIGLLSYSIYLWHFPIFSYFKVALIDLNFGQKLACILLSIALAILSYRYVEKPLRDPKKVTIRKFLLGLFGTTVLILSLSAWAYLSQGIPQRYDDYDNVLGYLSYPFEKSFLSHTCFLHPEELKAKTGFQNCRYNGDQNEGRPSLFLWGDSNAAHLIPGIRHKFEETHELTIRTISGCGVFMTEHIPTRPGCNKLNQETLEKIIHAKPDMLIIGGWWKHEFIDRLGTTLEQLRNAEIKNVTVIGPVPEWSPSLPASILAFRKENKTARNFPSYLKDPKHSPIKSIDLKLNEEVIAYDYEYLSAIKRLCTDEGCLTNVDGKLTQWDYGHLTDEGSIYLIDAM